MLHYLGLYGDGYRERGLSSTARLHRNLLGLQFVFFEPALHLGASLQLLRKSILLVLQSLFDLARRSLFKHL